MHKLPPKDHPAAAMFDVASLVEIGTGQLRAATLQEALSSAKRSFAASPKGLVLRINYIVRKADDALWLISVGPRGGWRKEWEFEPPYHKRGA